MALIELLTEIHSNTRRTRITYLARIDEALAAIKCYRRPLFGLVHWLRAERRGRRLRKVGAPVPPVAYSGWVPGKRCFGFATEFLDGYRPMRQVLREAESPEVLQHLIGVLGRTVADLHQRGVEQPDGNLTNFLVDERDRVAMVDEDDIRVFRGGLPIGVEISNLANIASRLPDERAVEVLLNAYMDARAPTDENVWDQAAFWAQVNGWRELFRAKRAKRNIADRRFD
ncbi:MULTISPECIES: hypothetical protein [Marinobacter]|uniref:hypothetical protein n=1 Tax=Marinobacter TaxID=2742 RepID=UPI0013A6A7E2|nr:MULTISPECIES: hypothetical protein [Marinobacter]